MSDPALVLLQSLFQPAFTAFFFILLWSMDVWIFQRLGIDYATVLGVRMDDRHTARASHLALAGGSLLAGLCLAEWLWLQFQGRLDVGGVLGFFALAVLVALLFPAPARLRRNLGAFWMVLAQVLYPTREVEFSHVFVADALTSVSSSLRDLTRAFLYLVASALPLMNAADAAAVGGSSGQVALSAVRKSLPAALLLEGAACAPYLLRMRQCWLCYRALGPGPQARGKRRGHLLNFLKYASAVPIFLVGAASAALRVNDQLTPSRMILMAYALLAARTLNSTYSLAWDVVMDWGLLRYTPKGGAALRSEGLLPYRACYPLAILLDAAGRFAWATVVLANLGVLTSGGGAAAAAAGAAHGAPAASLGRLFGQSLFFHSLEVARRAMWNVLRVEWEVLSRSSTEQDKLLPGAKDEAAAAPDLESVEMQ